MRTTAPGVRWLLAVAIVLVWPGVPSMGQQRSAEGFLAGIQLQTGTRVDRYFVAPGVDLSGRRVRVRAFENRARKPRGDAALDVPWADLGGTMADALIEATTAGQLGVALDRNAGDLVLMGAILDYRPPKRVADWDGWIGRASSSGSLVFAFRIEDADGRVLVGVQHRLETPSSGSVRRQIGRAFREDVLEAFERATGQ